MGDLKVNSLRLKFERGSAEPSDLDIFAFMKEKMKIPCDSLMCMYKEKSTTSVIIKFKTEEGMKRVLDRLPGTMEFGPNKYQSCKVQLSAANAVVRYVRLFNLPPEVEDREIWNVMAKYGKIQRMVREKYGVETGYPIWTSVRGVYMEVKEGEEIPATVHVRNMRARVYYEGLVNKCFQCGSTEHLKVDCPQRTTVNVRLNEEQSSSYSGALKGAWVKPKPTTDGMPTGGKSEGEMTNLNNLFPAISTKNRNQVTEGNSKSGGEDGEQGLFENDDHPATVEAGIEQRKKQNETDEVSKSAPDSERRETSLKRDRVIDTQSSGEDSGDGMQSEANLIPDTTKINSITEWQRVMTRSRSKLSKTNGKGKGDKINAGEPGKSTEVGEGDMIGDDHDV